MGCDMTIEESLKIMADELESRKESILYEIEYYSKKVEEFKIDLELLKEKISAFNEIKKICTIRLVK